MKGRGEYAWAPYKWITPSARWNFAPASAQLCKHSAATRVPPRIAWAERSADGQPILGSGVADRLKEQLSRMRAPAHESLARLAIEQRPA